MVGFALIIILVAVIFIVFIASYIRKSPEKVEDYEANSFVQALLQYTTSCEDDNSNRVNVQRLIQRCKENERCTYDKDPCVILKETVEKIIEESWGVGPKNTVKGYYFTINKSETEQILKVEEGVVTNNYRTGLQDFGDPHEGENIIILFNVYS